MNYNLNDTPFVKKMQTMAFAMLALGVVLLGASAAGGSQNFWAGYIMGFQYFTGIGATMMFFSTIGFLMNVGWSAAIRRIAELLSFFVYLVPILAIPILIAVMGDLHVYHWVNSSDEHLTHGFKGFYLNKLFFCGRIVFYCLAWILMHRFIIGNSIKQDTATDIEPTRKNWKRAAPFILLYAITITFEAFDVVMSLEPHWFSTIFGVYSFAGHWVSTVSIILILVNTLDNGGYLKGLVSREHYHDLGKLMFAFTVFWTYIAFSQYFIIWYANIPEETFFYTNRLQGGWEVFGWSSLFIHFFAPFLFLLRQDIKRNPRVVRIGAFLLLFAHFIDLSWVILPVFGGHGEHTHFSPMLLMAGV
ncbi:MAG: hypothetical protein JNL32_13295, partial [Candidatus Kapabacteria bacterium]|nr:hypothetical protein [Candidatus Kapabacteria bacterium]